jgi:small subunit ribosomal protein S20
MANIRSAEKQMRQANKARERNRATKSRLRTQLKKVKTAIEETSDDLKGVLAESYSVIDKAARKKVIKVNTADRYKSRLAVAAKRNAR